jgi:hypothetical protein
VSGRAKSYLQVVVPSDVAAANLMPNWLLVVVFLNLLVAIFATMQHFEQHCSKVLQCGTLLWCCSKCGTLLWCCSKCCTASECCKFLLNVQHFERHRTLLLSLRQNVQQKVLPFKQQSACKKSAVFEA